jgi:hypothetical protein
MKTPKIGDRIRFNNGVSTNYINKKGTVYAIRYSVICGEVFEVKLDDPTPAAVGWPVLLTLGAAAHCINVIG